MRRHPSGARRLCQHIAVIMAYLALTLVMTYPLGLRMSTHLLRSSSDFWIFPWNNWWISKALTGGYNIYYTPYLFHPQGVSLVLHCFSWFNSFVWLLFQPVVGSLTAHNITILLTYVVGAYTTYLLAYEVTGARPAAFVAGLVYAFYPHRFEHRGQLNLLSNQWNPLFAFYLVRLTRRGRLRDGLGMGVALALCGLCDWRQMLMAGMWGGMWLACSLVAEHRWWNWSTASALLVGCLSCAVLVTPLLVPVIAEWLHFPEAGLEAGRVQKGLDLLDYFLPYRYHPLFRLDGLYDLYRRYVHFKGRGATVGWVALLLTAWSVKKRRREALPWFLQALVFVVLALGPVLEVNGHAFPGFPLPYALLNFTLLGKAVRHPHRFNIILALPISVLVALGWQGLLTRWGLRRWQVWGVTLCLTLLILFEYCIAPVPTIRSPDSVFYQRLQEEEGEFAVADFPVCCYKYYMFLQTLHGRPMVGGHVSRELVDTVDSTEEVSLLAEEGEGLLGEEELGDVSRQLRSLAGVGVRYAIVHKDLTTEEELERWRRWFGFWPVYEDGLLLAYRTEPAYGRDFEFMAEMGDGIGVVTTTFSSQTVSAGGTVRLDVVWGTRQKPERDWTGRLLLLSGNGEEAGIVEFELFEGWPTSQWNRDEVVYGVVAMEISPFLREGRYQVMMGLVDGSGEEALLGERVKVGEVAILARE